jgi:hypothetical protein
MTPRLPFRCARVALALAALSAASQAQLVATDLNSGLTPDDLVNTLLGGAISISNVTYVGANAGAGTFSGGTGILGFDAGIVLSSGDVANVTAVGMLNNFDDVTLDNSLGGDPDLDSLIPGYQTYDASVLEFDFDCPTLQLLSFEYVFSSDEYNEYVNTSYNDVFGFFVNGVNVALLADGVTPVSINNVNGGNPFGVGASNPQEYINNDCDDLASAGGFPCLPFVQTEMDGRTVVLTVFTTVSPGTNHIKLAIADAGDHVLDSNVFVKAHTFNCGPPCPRPENYCSAKLSSVGCLPEIEMSDSPSASGLTVCELETNYVIANKPGFYLHTIAGPQAMPFHGGTLCIATPLRRHTPRLAVGAGVGCDGRYEEDFNAYIASGRDPSLVEGTVVWIQTWARDPNAAYGDSLSDAVVATICP